jgi:hypothetical protein
MLLLPDLALKEGGGTGSHNKIMVVTPSSEEGPRLLWETKGNILGRAALVCLDHRTTGKCHPPPPTARQAPLIPMGRDLEGPTEDILQGTRGSDLAMADRPLDLGKVLEPSQESLSLLAGHT